MRKIILVAFMSLDNVVQGGGAPDEDTSGGFEHGGWLAPYADESLMEALKISYGRPYDLMLGRKTYDIFAAYWPKKAEDPNAERGDIDFATEFNACTKYVATHSPKTMNWKNTEWLGENVVQRISELKKSGDKNLLVVGSPNFSHTLLANDLVDELHLFITPIVLGKGKRLFDESSHARAFKLERSVTSKTGMILLKYSRAGEIQTGSMG